MIYVKGIFQFSFIFKYKHILNDHYAVIYTKLRSQASLNAEGRISEIYQLYLCMTSRISNAFIWNEETIGEIILKNI